ncbi:MAG: hypothetical protein KKA42_11455, partial [candidate division Zixibacteria bacterium]|nr:hypothetical protein [candidate division Zixibacteria bacterium]
MREDYLSDPDIQRQKEEWLKSLLVERYVVDKVMPQIKLDTADVKNMYLAHKDDRYGGASYDSVKAQVFLDYQTQKMGAAYREYIDRLAAAEKVTFLDHNVR